jgi:hypothetical protein
MWWERLLTGVGFQDDNLTRIYCDNQQTVDLVTKGSRQAYTKLRHVKIAEYWTRQENQAKNIKVEWIKTSDMTADGLTKALPRANHEKFVRQLGLVDIRHMVQETESE